MQSTPTGMKIPKRVKYLSESEIPGDYSKSVNGTLYGTTPGGTRIIYELDQMYKLRNSPLSQTPPANLVYVEGVTRGIQLNKNQNLEQEYKKIIDLNNNRFSQKPQKIVEERSDTDFLLEL